MSFVKHTGGGWVWVGPVGGKGREPSVSCRRWRRKKGAKERRQKLRRRIFQRDLVQERERKERGNFQSRPFFSFFPFAAAGFSGVGSHFVCLFFPRSGYRYRSLHCFFGVCMAEMGLFFGRGEGGRGGGGGNKRNLWSKHVVRSK